MGMFQQPLRQPTRGKSSGSKQARTATGQFAAKTSGQKGGEGEAVNKPLQAVPMAIAPPVRPFAAPFAAAVDPPARRCGEIARAKLQELAAEKKGSISISGPIEHPSSLTVAPECPVTLTCAAGHKVDTLARLAFSWCEICFCLALMNFNYPSSGHITCIESEYEKSQLHFVFRCGAAGHMFTASRKNASERCPVCSMIERATRTFGLGQCTLQMHPDSVYNGNKNKVRMRCSAVRHTVPCPNLACEGAEYGAPRCPNIEHCDQDFLVSPLSLTKTYSTHSCATGHKWAWSAGIMYTVMAFEMLFGCPFQDYLYGAEYTGYNARAKLAFTCRDDQLPERAIRAMGETATQLGVTFIVVPASAKGATEDELREQVFKYVAETVAETGILGTDTAASVLLEYLQAEYTARDSDRRYFSKFTSHNAPVQQLAAETSAPKKSRKSGPQTGPEGVARPEVWTRGAKKPISGVKGARGWK